MEKVKQKMNLYQTVGILTTFRQTNFGSVLQAYSLQKVIENLGYEAKVIDYKYPNEFHRARCNRFKTPPPLTLSKKIKILVKTLLEILGLRPIPKMKLLNRFIDNEMCCTDYYPTHDSIHRNPPQFDIYVSGSDQIWNPNTMYGDMTYLFDFAPDGAKIISYSSSFSCDYVPEQYIEDYKKYLARYSAISVRESNGIRLAESLTGRNDIKHVLDPTLLLNKEQWLKLAAKSRKLKTPPKYILCYMLAYTYNPEEKMKELLKYVQDKYQLPIITLSRINQWDGDTMIRIEKKQSIGCYEFLDLIDKAEIIVTSSFHGTAFAINFGKPFLALQNGKSNSDDRISSLLPMVKLDSQLVTTETHLSDNISPYYDAVKAIDKLNQIRKSSISFLKNSLFS